jgi:fatty acid amide hydrolase
MTSAYRFGETIGIVLINPRYYFTVAVGAIAGILSLSCIIKKISKALKESEWDKQAAIVRKDRDVKIENFMREHREIKITEERKRYILSLTAVKLIEQIKARKVSAVEALLVYINRAATIGKELSLIADVDFEAAYRQAEEVDLKLHQNKVTDDLTLLGLPISIKDHIAVKGALLTAGFTSQSNYLIGNDSDIVAVLRSKGAIPFVISNVPQGMLTFETSNRLWGNAMNPWNRKRTTGGSSGGEAGLVASKCSPCGIGSDILGSIRLPSAFCGIYGFKPTLKRISLLGVHSYAPGFPEVQYSLGPMCRSIEDIALILRNLFGHFSDTTVYNEPFNEVVYNDTNNIKIAYMVDNAFFETAPVIKETITDVAEKLMKKGYDMIPVRFDIVRELIETGNILVANSEGLENIEQALQGEAIAHYYYNLLYLRRSSNWCISFIAFMKNLMGEHRLAHTTKAFKKISRKDYIDHIAKFNQLKNDYIKFLIANRYEAIICPVFPTPASHLNTGFEIFNLNQFICLFNYLDMPAGVVPITLNTSQEYTSKVNDSLTTFMKDTMKESINLPIAIQVASLPNRDEICLRVMKDIDSFYSFDINVANNVVDLLAVSKSIDGINTIVK